MFKKASLLLAWLIAFTAVVSCGDSTSTYDPYYEWQSRNTAWYLQIAQTARDSIRYAQNQYGLSWEQHCNWRMYKSLMLSPNFQSNNTTDSICVHINKRGYGHYSPLYSDTVRVSFRGWLMPTQDQDGNTFEYVFAQTYYGDYNPDTSAPQIGAVGSFAVGFSTALQYMVEGDDWDVYIPQQLFYRSEVKGTVKAYSTVRFRIQMRAVYPFGTGIPEWH